MSKNTSLDLLKMLYKETKDCILIFDADLNVCFISDPFKVLTPELKVSQNISEFLDDDWQNTFCVIICGFESNITPILDEQGNICLYVLKTSNKYIIPSCEYPFFSEALRSSIIDLSQKIFTPLTIMFSSFTYITKNLQDKSIDNKVKKSFKVIRKNFYLILKIVGNISDIASVNSYDLRSELYLKTINIVDFIKNTVSSINEFSEKLDIPIILNIPADLSIYISVDIRKLERILLILISNCFKYTKENSQINVALNETLNHITISICDKGIGMSKETINKIFSPHRTNELRNKINGSSLIIAKIFIDQMGGTMIIESTPGIGTKISFSISKNLTSNLVLSTANEPNPKGLLSQKYIEFCDIIEYDNIP